MMYHLKFSLTGGARCSVGSPAAFASGFCSSGFCSVAAMVVPFARIRLLLSTGLAGNAKFCCLVVLGQTMEQSFDCPPDNIVHQPEVRGEDEDCDENDDRGRL